MNGILLKRVGLYVYDVLWLLSGSALLPLLYMGGLLFFPFYYYLSYLFSFLSFLTPDIISLLSIPKILILLACSLPLIYRKRLLGFFVPLLAPIIGAFVIFPLFSYEMTTFPLTGVYAFSATGDRSSYITFDAYAGDLIFVILTTYLLILFFCTFTFKTNFINLLKSKISNWLVIASFLALFILAEYVIGLVSNYFVKELSDPFLFNTTPIKFVTFDREKALKTAYKIPETNRNSCAETYETTKKAQSLYKETFGNKAAESWKKKGDVSLLNGEAHMTGRGEDSYFFSTISIPQNTDFMCFDYLWKGADKDRFIVFVDKEYVAQIDLPFTQERGSSGPISLSPYKGKTVTITFLLTNEEQRPARIAEAAIDNLTFYRSITIGD